MALKRIPSRGIRDRLLCPTCERATFDVLWILQKIILCLFGLVNVATITESEHPTTRV